MKRNKPGERAVPKNKPPTPKKGGPGQFPRNEGNRNGSGPRNDHRIEQVIAALLTSKSVYEASQRIGMGYRTLKDWLKRDEFRAEYDAAKHELLDQTINMLRSAGWKGVTTLEEVATNRKAAPTARTMAARGLLEVLLRAVETQDLASRVAALEAGRDKSKEAY